mmetsp:Transcript_43002/g.111127  ORF Transcript_43002/g.111127 Transcript_43002/m.111127 type:complete len:230 (+) Transcript_43002:1470-2159(+)
MLSFFKEKRARKGLIDPVVHVHHAGSPRARFSNIDVLATSFPALFNDVQAVEVALQDIAHNGAVRQRGGKAVYSSHAALILVWMGKDIVVCSLQACHKAASVLHILPHSYLDVATCRATQPSHLPLLLAQCVSYFEYIHLFRRERNDAKVIRPSQHVHALYLFYLLRQVLADRVDLVGTLFVPSLAHRHHCRPRACNNTAWPTTAKGSRCVQASDPLSSDSVLVSPERV